MTISNNTSIFWRKSTTKRNENKEQRKGDGDDYNDDDDNFTQWNTKKLTFTLKWHLSFDVRNILLYVHKFWSSFINHLTLFIIYHITQWIFCSSTKEKTSYKTSYSIITLTSIL